MSAREKLTAILKADLEPWLAGFYAGVTDEEFHPRTASITAEELAEDLAVMLEQKLGLVEEKRTLTDGWVQPTRNAVYYAMGMEPPPAVITHEHRWVTEWEAVG